MKPIVRLLAFLMIASLALPSPAQTPDWQWARAGRGTDNGIGRAIATDPDGNVFVTGYFEGSVTFGNTILTSPGETDLFLTKYDSTGRVLWTKRAGGFQGVRATALSVDPSGNAYVVGTFQGNAQFDGVTLQNPSTIVNDLFIAKYSNAGTLQWAKQVGGSSYEGANAICTDPNGGVYVSGWLTTGKNYRDEQTAFSFGSVTVTVPGANGTFLAKYDADGNAVWARANTNPMDASALITSLAADPAGTVYFAG
ncbi:MAG TPA: SBBP repeat-containing protein, partial [Cytophagales bacterium]